MATPPTLGGQLDDPVSSNLDWSAGEKGSLLSLLTMKQIPRLSPKRLSILLVGILLLPACLTMSILYNQRYISDDQQGVLRVGHLKQPQANAPRPHGIPNLPKGVYVAPTVDQNELHALLDGTLEQPNQGGDAPKAAPMVPRPLKPGQRPGPPVGKPRIKIMPDMPFKTAKPDQHDAPAIDPNQPMPPAGYIPNIHGMPTQSNTPADEQAGAAPVDVNQNGSPIQPITFVLADPGQLIAGGRLIVPVQYIPPGEPVPGQPILGQPANEQPIPPVVPVAHAEQPIPAGEPENPPVVPVAHPAQPIPAGDGPDAPVVPVAHPDQPIPVGEPIKEGEPAPQLAPPTPPEASAHGPPPKGQPAEVPPPPEQPPAIVHTPPPGNHKFVIILAVDGPTPNICKTILSGMANGYPSPVIVNWDSVSGEREKNPFARLEATIEYLDTMMDRNAHRDDKLKEDDLVVLVDPSDSWWQLPPDTLIKRYHESNRLANERLAAEGNPERQQMIVAAAQKRCWPAISSDLDLHCDALPASSARGYLYGPETDKDVLDKDSPSVYKLNRPKFLSSGHIMGPAGDMKRYLKRAQARMSSVHRSKMGFKLDQGALGLVLGEQEVWRAWLRKQNGEATNPDEPPSPAVQMVLDDFEYSLGLDYSQTISLPMVAGQRDGELLRLDNATFIAQASSKLGIDPVRLVGVPDDIKSTPNPLEALLGDEMVMSWGQMPLYADLHSQAVPVMVHNNEPPTKGNREGRLAKLWNRTWFFPHLRNLARKYLDSTTAPPMLAQVPAGDGTAKYWALPSEGLKRKPRRFAAGAAKEGLPEMAWDDVCQAGAAADAKKPWYEDLFGDGLGSLERAK